LPIDEVVHVMIPAVLAMAQMVDVAAASGLR
jgi:hypothetical protein